MKSKLLSIVREWFNYSSTERWGITALTVILLILIILPVFFKKNTLAVEDMERLKQEMDVFLAEMNKKPSANKLDTVFFFDPNTIDSASMVLLGFSPRQARSIVNYRNKGGKFYNKESFGKSFAVSDEMFARLYNYIDIKQERKQIADKTPKTSKTSKIIETKQPHNDDRNKNPTVPASVNKVKTRTVELNIADTAKLKELRGIGQYYAQRIVEYRNKLGGFVDAAQLMEIKGIDSTRFAMFRDQISIDIAQIKRININTVSEKELSKHPYINSYVAKSIIKYRQFKGTIASVVELLNENILTKKQSDKISAYLEF
ncbi:MAG: helix-hairpin-helix domain-containing protein [Prevotellaceae bacterium]|jgi:DNA uptake protein ComE-like DNA-binding protein|nr:helix-hairpin-helix domain-containing protein [Prevotellaceae bacterium]